MLQVIVFAALTLLSSGVLLGYVLGVRLERSRNSLHKPVYYQVTDEEYKELMSLNNDYAT